jgi:DNA mismatch endonuclease, patch repair protein
MSSRSDFGSISSSRRSNMRAIRSRGNRSTELRFRGLITRSGLRGWRLHPAQVAGAPDFYFPRARLAVFVDGCFWHGCPRCGHVPKTNRPYWIKKLARNKQRDAQVRSTLHSDGVSVIRIWECRLRDEPASCLRRLVSALGRPPEPPTRRP